MRFAIRNIHKISERYGEKFAVTLKDLIKNNSDFTELPPDKNYRVIQIENYEFYVISQRYDCLMQ